MGAKSCFHYKENNLWKMLSWADAEEEVRRLSLGLASLGIKPGDAVALISQTRVEWTLLDLSILACQGVTVPVYPTLAPDQVAFILKDSKSALLILENQTEWEKLRGVLGDWSQPVLLIEGKKEGCLSLAELKEKGKSLPVNLYDENLRQIKPSQTATIVYTSGTTGLPKGALLTHRNLLGEVQGLSEALQFSQNEIGLMCLPLAHVIARAMQFYQLAQGCQAAYAESLEKLPQNLREVRPHFMAVVPRLLEKSHAKIMERIDQSFFPVKKMMGPSLGLGFKISNMIQKRIPPPMFDRFLYQLVSLSLFGAIRKGFGGRLRVIISGGAPLSKEIAQFFHAVGILVIEGYGLTETFAAVAINRPDDFRFGTVGKPLEGLRVKIAADGEICVKGDTVFSGYLGLQEETEKVFDGEGWLLTGDIGEFTKDGFLKITDRKKDIIVTSSGKKVAPQNLENRLQLSPYIAQAFVHGDRRNFLSALVTLNWEAIEGFAKNKGIPFVSREDLSSNQKIRDLLQTEIETCNRELSSFETIKKFAILPENFSMERGELTPTMKVKRKVVVEKYKEIINNFYN